MEPTPLCLMFGQGHQHFLERLSAVPRERQPPDRKAGRAKVSISETACLREALFTAWSRPDATQSFRWDPHEDVRYALRATDPSDYKTKASTQHGANRLAAIGSFRHHRGATAPSRGNYPACGPRWEAAIAPAGSFSFTWPIWREPGKPRRHPQLARPSRASPTRSPERASASSSCAGHVESRSAGS